MGVDYGLPKLVKSTTSDQAQGDGQIHYGRSTRLSSTLVRPSTVDGQGLSTVVMAEYVVIKYMVLIVVKGQG